MTYRLTVNGAASEVEAPGMRRLLDVLREDLGLTGTKEGCGEGECGACSVLVDGMVVDACLVPLCQVDGAAVDTVEGLAAGHGLNTLQAAFLETGGAQCGICTPGMLMAGEAFLASGAEPTEDAVREAIAGNLCRCTGYTKIIDAIVLAAERQAAAQMDTQALPMPAEPPVETPASLTDAYRLLADGGVAWRPVAGGTDLLVQITGELGPPPDRVLNIWGLDELRGINLEGDELVIGALTTYTELRVSALIGELLPALAAASATIGAAQIQNRGTVGGNLANASPAGDTLPIWLATDSQVVLGSDSGERSVPAAEFFTAYRQTARRDDELVLRVRVPLLPRRHVRFRKVGTRRAQAISKVVLALSWITADDGTWQHTRVTLGSVAATPIRARATEAALDGRHPVRTTADEAVTALEGEITPIDDVRSTADYRRQVAGRVLHRLIREEGGW